MKFFEGDNTKFEDLKHVMPLSSDCKKVTNGESHLFVGGVDVCEVAKEFGTPLVLVDEAGVRKNLRDYRDTLASGLKKSRVCYAFKAFTCFEMARIVNDEDCWLLVASGEELEYAIMAGFPSEKIVFHGCNKTEKELELAMTLNIARIVVDSGQEVSKIDALAEKCNFKPSVLLRIRPGVIADTHEYIQTANEDSKFGVSIASGEALEVIKMILKSENLSLVGFQFHIGSNIFNIEAFEKSLSIYFDFASEVYSKCSYFADELDIGGGLGIAYTIDDTPPTISDFCEYVTNKVLHLCNEKNIPEPLVAVEPGRSIAGKEVINIYKAGTIKEIEGIRTYVNVDGGMADNIRPMLYDALYECFAANKADQARSQLVTLVGRYCESDTIIDRASIQKIESGDVIVVFSTGGYCFSMSMNYNMAKKPAVVFVKDGSSRLVLRRQTIDDIASCEI